MYLTIADMRFYFNEIWDHLEYCLEGNQYMLTDSINQKIEEYWTILDEATTIATILHQEIFTAKVCVNLQFCKFAKVYSVIF